MSTFIEIAERLSKLLTDRAQAGLREWQAGKDADARRLELTPAGGWEGKNQEQRDAARDKAFAEDETLAQMVEAQAQDHIELVLIEADISSLDAERRGMEWTVRDRLVDALRLGGIPAPGNGKVETVAFDAAADERAFWDEVEKPSGIGDELPF